MVDKVTKAKSDTPAAPSTAKVKILTNGHTHKGVAVPKDTVIEVTEGAAERLIAKKAAEKA